MNARTSITLLSVAVAVLLLVKAIQEQGRSAATQKTDSPVVAIVSETLHQHEGEQSPFVQAFEDALEHRAHA